MTRGTWGRGGASRRDDAEMDAMLAEAWEAGAAALARTLDLEAGRATLMTLAQQGADSKPAGGALAVVLAQADAMLALIRTHAQPDYGPAHSHLAAFLFASLQHLRQLRSGLAARSLSKDGAWQLLAGLDHALQEAGRTLSALPPGAVTEEETAEVGGLLTAMNLQLPAMARRIERLFDDADHLSAGVPAPTR
jgi:hypothetical protein